MTQKNTMMTRQAITITISELQDLIVNLSQELTDLKVIESGGYGDIKFQVDICNPKPKCSDTWRIETSLMYEEMQKKLNSQQPEVLASQGEGEMDGKSYLPKTRSTVEANESCSNLASSTQNPSADTIPKSKYINKLI